MLPHKPFPRSPTESHVLLATAQEATKANAAMMLMSASTPTEADRLYPDSPLAAKATHSRINYHRQPDRHRWLKLRALLGVGLVVAATALALFASQHQQALVTPQALLSRAGKAVHSAGDARASLRDSLFQAFGLVPPQADASPPEPPVAKPLIEELAPPPSSVSLDRKKWNWLSPSGPSFSAMKEPDKELVTVSAIYKHMLDKRHAQVADAVSELLHAELNYNLTLTCFDEAIMQVRTVISTLGLTTSLSHHGRLISCR